MSYRNTTQADALKLVAKKLQSSLAVEGELPEDGLAVRRQRDLDIWDRFASGDSGHWMAPSNSQASCSTAPDKRVLSPDTNCWTSSADNLLHSPGPSNFVTSS